MHQIDLPLMMTDTMRRLQRKLNHASTAEQANLSEAGWTAQLILNGQPPGKWVDDPETNQRVFKPDPMSMGSGIINFISGQELEGDDGRTHVTTPSYVQRLPSPPDTFLKTKEATYIRMLQRAHQVHAVLAGLAQASGESRLRARGDFENSLMPTKAQIDAAFAWLIETALSMTSVMMNRPEQFANIETNVSAQLDLGVIVPSEANMVITLRDNGLLSQQTAMSRVGIDDVESERALIEQEMMEIETDEPAPEPSPSS